MPEFEASTQGHSANHSHRNDSSFSELKGLKKISHVTLRKTCVQAHETLEACPHTMFTQH